MLPSRSSIHYSGQMLQTASSLPAPSLPPTIGQYEVLGRLAKGGMAEILLGRLTGPYAFERPVVIKRILPHLARKQSFVNMFLDEARIVAAIRHPKVVQVQELGYHDGELFLIMEYLEGESLGGVMRRLWSRGETLSPQLAAFIIAEACSGLHAAHELKDNSGTLRHVVHRDICPNNLMLTYPGEIKVLDFGIAKADGRSTRTDVGQLKGKHEYMSPEQCRGRPLDRRSDIFSLGIVLYELSVARRLFKRSNKLLTSQAVCVEPIPPPSSLVQGYPPCLEKICLRALGRNVDDRYPTALEMRRDLMACVRGLGGDELHEESIARMMHRLFPERIEEKKEMLRRVRAGSHPERLPKAETDTTVDIPDVGDGSISEQAAANGPAQVKRLWLSPRSFSGSLFYGGVLLALGAAAAAVVSYGKYRQFPHNEKSDAGLSHGVPGQERAAPGGVGDEPTQAQSPRLERAESAGSLPAKNIEVPPVLSSSKESEAERAPVAAASRIVIRIESVPSKATIKVDGHVVGSTPHDLELPQSKETVTLYVSRKGFLPVVQRVLSDSDQRVVVHLRPTSRRNLRSLPSQESSGPPPRQDKHETPKRSPQDFPKESKEDPEIFKRFN